MSPRKICKKKNIDPEFSGLESLAGTDMVTLGHLRMSKKTSIRE
jgi:hypothetical protein